MVLTNVSCCLQVKVFRVDDVQGKEYRALIISTVRTCASDAKRVDEIEMEDGFFTNAKVRSSFYHDNSKMHGPHASHFRDCIVHVLVNCIVHVHVHLP